MSLQVAMLTRSITLVTGFTSSSFFNWNPARILLTSGTEYPREFVSTFKEHEHRSSLSLHFDTVVLYVVLGVADCDKGGDEEWGRALSCWPSRCRPYNFSFYHFWSCVLTFLLGAETCQNRLTEIPESVRWTAQLEESSLRLRLCDTPARAKGSPRSTYWP